MYHSAGGEVLVLKILAAEKVEVGATVYCRPTVLIDRQSTGSRQPTPLAVAVKQNY